eukprot:CAMPEP_0169303238 /NCGR_PEP_ID=MMETSP1016-20121227/69240_1 /TAXON_ID=342587 /ORGANISM="Karlodinium micrum, Strain CCMP2283" /LENGTH=164 /DNA_ID=CAMNT_0009396029 /DNA_START=276 /DNA_END=770 /DNA_ORIENTATION=-
MSKTLPSRQLTHNCKGILASVFPDGLLTSLKPLPTPRSRILALCVTAMDFRFAPPWPISFGTKSNSLICWSDKQNTNRVVPFFDAVSSDELIELEWLSDKTASARVDAEERLSDKLASMRVDAEERLSEKLASVRIDAEEIRPAGNGISFTSGNRKVSTIAGVL